MCSTPDGDETTWIAVDVIEKEDGRDRIGCEGGESTREGTNNILTTQAFRNATGRDTHAAHQDVGVGTYGRHK
jgi:hypothetical protein